MKLDKNGYRSERRGSFATAVKILTFIFGVGVVVAAVCMYAMFSGCGSNGSGDGEPVYDENGVCVENCGNGDGANDGSVYPPGDTCDHDGCGFQPQKDYVAPPCHVPTDPKIKEWCMPYEAKSTYCALPGDDYPPLSCGGEEGCYCWGPWVHEMVYCSTSSECRKGIPCAAWPPEVCQGLPCLLVGKWQCPSSVHDYTNAEFYDNGDGYCRIHTQSEGNIYFKPGDEHFQRPPSGPAEIEYSLSEDGSQLFGGTGGYDPSPYTCIKMAEK